MLTTIIPALDTITLGGIIISGGRRRFSGQRSYYPKMRQHPQEEGKPKKGPTPKPRGHPRDSPEIRISKSLSWLLRHGAEKAGLDIRQDGYAKVSDVVSLQHLQWRSVELTLSGSFPTPCSEMSRSHTYKIS
jgi:hypothetical protein